MDHDLIEYILNVSRHMAETKSLTPLLNYVIDEAINLVGAERGYVVLVQPDKTLDFRAKRGQDGQELDSAEDLISTSILNKVVDSSLPLVLRNAMHDPRFGQAESVIVLGLRSIMCVPLITRGQTIGAIYVENRSIRGRFSQDDLPPLSLFANQAAPAIENAILIEDLETRVASRTGELEAAMLQVEQSWAEAVEANRLRTVWLSKITHDLRAPLGIATAAMSFLQEGGLGSLNVDQLTWIEKSLKSMEHIADLADSLFDISKLELGGIRLHKELTDLEEFLQGVYEIGLGISWPKAVTFSLNTASTLPKIWLDPVRIRQVLLNLLTNAHKYTQKGRVRLHARFLVNQGIVVLGVADTGEGIAADKLDLLFQRFQQVDDNQQRRQRGSGLGLAICRELVEMHSGRIWVESIEGKGSNFQLTLPAPSS